MTNSTISNSATISVRTGAGRGQHSMPRPAPHAGTGCEMLAPPRPATSGAPPGERPGDPYLRPRAVHRSGAPCVFAGPRFSLRCTAYSWGTFRGPASCYSSLTFPSAPSGAPPFFTVYRPFPVHRPGPHFSLSCNSQVPPFSGNLPPVRCLRPRFRFRPPSDLLESVYCLYCLPLIDGQRSITTNVRLQPGFN